MFKHVISPPVKLAALKRAKKMNFQELSPFPNFLTKKYRLMELNFNPNWFVRKRNQ